MEENLGVITTGASIIAVVLVCMCILLLIKPIRAKVKAKLIETKNKMIWNGLIRMITLGYINYCAMWTVNLSAKFIDPIEEPKISEYIITPLLGILLFSYPICCFIILWRTPNEELQQKKTKDSFKNMYPNVNVWS